MSGSTGLQAHDGGGFAAVPARLVANWPEGSFVENIAVDGAGVMFVTIHNTGEIWRVEPAGASTMFVRLPMPVAGLGFDAAGALFVSAGTPGVAGGAIWRVAADGAYARWLDLPEARFLNGMTPAPDGGMLVVDSILGRIWHFGTARPALAVWFEDERLRPLAGAQGLPGVNGIKRFAGAYALSNTTRAEIFSLALGPAGAPGALTLRAARLRADDIAFDVQGALYCTTHMHHSLVRLSPDGSRVTIAGPAEGMAGSTAAAFGRTADDATALYVTATGGVGAPFGGVLQAAKLVRLELGVAGAALAGW